MAQKLLMGYFAACTGTILTLARFLFFTLMITGQAFANSEALDDLKQLDKSLESLIDAIPNPEVSEQTITSLSQSYLDLLHEVIENVKHSDPERVSAIQKHLLSTDNLINSKISHLVLNQGPFREEFEHYDTTVKLAALSLRIYNVIMPFSKYGSPKETVRNYLRYGQIEISIGQTLLKILPDRFAVDEERFIDRRVIIKFLETTYYITIRIIKTIDEHSVDSSFFWKNVKALTKIASSLVVSREVSSYMYYTGDFTYTGTMSLLSILSISKSLINDDVQAIDGIKAFAVIGSNINSYFDFLESEFDNGLPEFQQLCGSSSIINISVPLGINISVPLASFVPLFRSIFIDSARADVFRGSLEITENLTACLRSDLPDLQKAVVSQIDDLIGFAPKFSSFVLRYYNDGTWSPKNEDNLETLHETIRLASASLVALQAAVEFVEYSKTADHEVQFEKIFGVFDELMDVPEGIVLLWLKTDVDNLKYFALEELGSISYAINRLSVYAYDGESGFNGYFQKKIDKLQKRVVDAIFMDLHELEDQNLGIISSKFDLLNDFRSYLDLNGNIVIIKTLELVDLSNERLNDASKNKNLIFDRFVAEALSQIDRFSGATPDKFSVLEAHSLIDSIRASCKKISNLVARKQLLDASMRLELRLVEHFSVYSSGPMGLIEHMIKFGSGKSLSEEARGRAVTKVVESLQLITREVDTIDRLNKLEQSFIEITLGSNYSKEQISKIKKGISDTRRKMRLSWFRDLPNLVKVALSLLTLTSIAAILVLSFWLVFPSIFFYFSKYSTKKLKGDTLLAEIGLKFIVGIFQLLGMLSRSPRTVESWIKANRSQFQSKVCDLKDDFIDSSTYCETKQFPYVEIGNSGLPEKWIEYLDSGEEARLWLTGQGGGFGITTIAKELAKRTMHRFESFSDKASNIVVFLHEKWDDNLFTTLAACRT